MNRGFFTRYQTQCIEVHIEEPVQIAKTGIRQLYFCLARPHLKTILFNSLQAKHQFYQSRLVAKILQRLAHHQSELDCHAPLGTGENPDSTKSTTRESVGSLKSAQRFRRNAVHGVAPVIASW